MDMSSFPQTGKLDASTNDPGSSNGWIDVEVNLSAYDGQRVYIGFNAFSDGSVVRDGWYIDDVALSAESRHNFQPKNQVGKPKGSGTMKPLKDGRSVKLWKKRKMQLKNQ